MRPRAWKPASRTAVGFAAAVVATSVATTTAKRSAVRSNRMAVSTELLAMLLLACGGQTSDMGTPIASCVVTTMSSTSCYDYIGSEVMTSEQACSAVAAFGKSQYRNNASCPTEMRTGTCTVPDRFIQRCYQPTTADACKAACSGTFTP